ncbi:MAG: C-GCAxxG-C-C family protein [Oscillospiraceae bacterium]
MEHETHAQAAMRLFKSGCNCSQAVLCAYCEELGMDTETALRLSSGFGGGMGRLREVCGAVTGAFMALDLKYASADLTDNAAKAAQYALIQRYAKAFEGECGSIICRELLGLSEKRSVPVPELRTAQYYKKRPCAELVGLACELLDAQFGMAEGAVGNEAP